MKLLSFIAAITVLVAGTSCKSKSGDSGPVLLCDTACLKDTIRFDGSHKLEPFVDIIPADCKPAIISFGYAGAVRKTNFDYPNVKLNKEFVRCIFDDTASATLLFNDCSNSRGYQIKLYYDKSKTYSTRTSGINNLDPKFSLTDNMVAYTDRGNIYVEDASTGKKAMMTFGEGIMDLDYDAIHEYIDSVNITDSRIWVKVKLKAGWKEMEKNITLE